MTPQMLSLLSRLDGMPVPAIAPERVWPVASEPLARSANPSCGRAVRQQHAARPGPVKEQSVIRAREELAEWLASWEAREERLEIRRELRAAGLL